MKHFKLNIYKRKKGSISKEEISDIYISDPYLILFYILLLIVETTILHNLRIFGIAPNLILISLIVITMFFDRATILKSAFYAGLLTDLLTGRGIGIHIIFYFIVVLCILKFESIIFKDNYLPSLALIFMFTVAYNLYIVGINLFGLLREGLAYEFLVQSGVESLYNIITGYLFYKIVHFSVYGKRRDVVE